jgi:hypothetical protein
MQKLGGNALVFDSCLVSSNMASCHTYTKCKGWRTIFLINSMAYQFNRIKIDDNKSYHVCYYTLNYTGAVRTP